MKSNNIDVSVGTIISLKPFFVTYATEKKMVLCLCKLCLNTQLIFETIMKEERKPGGEHFSSICDFFMNSFEYFHSSNGFYSWKFVTAKCKQCKNICGPKLVSEDENYLVTYSQSEETKNEQSTTWIIQRKFLNFLNMSHNIHILIKNNILYIVL